MTKPHFKNKESRHIVTTIVRLGRMHSIAQGIQGMVFKVNDAGNRAKALFKN